MLYYGLSQKNSDKRTKRRHDPDGCELQAAAHKERGWTQEDAAKRAGVSFKYVGHIETCVSGLGKRARMKWAEIFGVDVSEFLKPINQSEQQQELALLKQQLESYGLDKLKRLRELLPLLLGEGDHSHAGKSKETKRGDAQKSKG